MKRIIAIVLMVTLLMTSYTIVYASTKKDKETDEKTQEENVESNITFKDVNATDWFYDSIIQVANVNPDFMQMFADELFRPQEYITFEEFLEWIGYSFMCLEDAEGKVDVPEKFGEWYLKEHNYFKNYMVDKVGSLYPENYGKNYDTGWRSKYSLAAASNVLEDENKYTDFRDINVKNSRGKLNPNLTRNVMAEVLYDALKSEYNENNNEIKNFNIEELKYICNMINDTTLADQKIFTVVSKGIMTVNNSKFNRTSYVTRAEAITALHRLINEDIRIPTDVPSLSNTFEDLPPVDLGPLHNIPTLSGKIVEEENKEHFDYGNEHKYVFYDADKVINDFNNLVKLMYNRDYNTIKNNEVEYSRKLNYYLSGIKEYKGKEYSGLRRYRINSELELIDRYIKKGEDQALIDSSLELIEWVKQQDNWIENFYDLWIQDTVNNKVKVQAEFYTSPDLLIYANGSPALRGTLRIKYDSHIKPDDIKYELDLFRTGKMEHDEGILEADKSNYNIYKDFNELPQIEVGKWYEIDVDVVFSDYVINSNLYVEDGDRSRLTYSYFYVLNVRELQTKLNK